MIHIKARNKNKAQDEAQDEAPNGLTPEQLQALVAEMKEHSRAHPVEILARIQSGEGPPLQHRRDFQYRGHRVRVLLTEEVLQPNNQVLAENLSVASLDGQPLPPSLLAEIVTAFFSGGEAAHLLRFPPLPDGIERLTRLIPLFSAEEKEAMQKGTL